MRRSPPLDTSRREATRALKRLGPYFIVSKIGQGGMGKVYLARHQYLNVHHAIKVLPASLSNNEVFVRRFLREAAHAARLNHPNIVRTLGADEYMGVYYMVMEFVPGQTLQEHCDLGSLDVTQAVLYTHQLALALEHAHEHGIVHRDVKPDNVLISLENTARLMDFGLGREIETAHAEQLTGAGIAVGTPHYMPPEQWRNQDIDHRSDIYALGVTLYHLLSMRFPYDGDNADEVAQAQRSGQPQRLEWVAPHVDVELRDIVERMIALRPSDRPQSTLEVCRALEDWWALAQPDEAPLHKSPSSGSLISHHDLLPPIHLRDTRVITPSERRPVADATRAPAVPMAHTVELWDGAVCIRHPRRGLRTDNTYCARYRSKDGSLQTACVFGTSFLGAEIVRSALRQTLKGFNNLSAVLIHESDARSRVQELAAFLRERAQEAVVAMSAETRIQFDLPGALDEHIILTSRVNNGLDLPTGQRLLPLETSFANQPGSVAYYDPLHHTLFTGALFSGFVHPLNDNVRAERNDWYGVKAFHQLFMPSTDAVQRALGWLESMDPPVARIAPATGLIIEGDVLRQFLERMRDTPLGLAEVDRQIRSGARLDEYTELLRYTLTKLQLQFDVDIRAEIEEDRDLRKYLDLSGDQPSVMGLGTETIEQVVALAAEQLDRSEEMELRFEVYMESERLRVSCPRLLLP